MSKINEIFGSNVFNDSVMKERLPKATYKALKKTIEQGTSLEAEVADVVAAAMRDWAVEKGATHFTHWFQPMTGITAEKHDAFINPTSDGKVILEFSGKELIKGEPDASSFPSGGLRATFEARGYTAWDCTSPAFIKDGSLCIPTAFCSYNGEALDKKTPLLRSMEVMKKVAEKHGLYCLLHEKPFAGVNGSGKHNNWSMGTDDGMNLLEPGTSPHENKQFLLFLCAVIKAVDEYPDLLRVSAANAGNDHRLGANEAPPAIISIFLGDQLEDILEQIEKGPATSSKCSSALTIGVNTLPALPKDATDRNRTSPFAFTGNKFEFRMVPSSASISGCNFVLNTIVAETLSEIADKLEKASDLNGEIQAILTDIVKNHKKVIFNGNGYSDEWVEEAARRGLPNIKSTVEAAKAMISEKNQAVLEKHGVLTKVEAESRYEITIENYNKIINIEALTTLEMAKRQILPAVIKFATSLAGSINTINATGLGVDVSAQADLLKEVSTLTASLKKNIGILEEVVAKADSFDGDIFDLGMMYRYEVFEQMSTLREDADKLETLVDKEFWPMPTYEDMLFNV